MRFAKAVTTWLLVILSVACGGDSGTGCTPDTQTFEATYDRPQHEFYRTTLVRQWEAAGYDCSSETLRSGLGVAIGTRWTCTGCR